MRKRGRLSSDPGALKEVGALVRIAAAGQPRQGTGNAESWWWLSRPLQACPKGLLSAEVGQVPKLSWGVRWGSLSCLQPRAMGVACGPIFS